MDKQTHTPGPWVAKAGLAKWNVATTTKPRSVNICSINTDRVEQEANARLIAAAPELLAALRDWLDFAEETLSEFDVEPCDAETLCPKCQPAGCINLKMQLARAAIAKATTEQES